MSTETEPFSSRFKKENRTTGVSRLKARYTEGVERENSRGSSGVSVSVGRYSRDRNEQAGTTKTESISERMNRLKLNDKKEKENEPSSDKEENAKDDDEEDQPKKSLKKGGSGAKRKQKRNMREKRRSTGVVIMPGQPSAAGDEDEKVTMENTMRNMDAGDPGNSASQASGDVEPTDELQTLRKKIKEYEETIEDWKDELAKAKKEIETLQKDNLRLKDENSALLRVVGSLSGGTGRK